MSAHPQPESSRYLFPAWTNRLPLYFLGGSVLFLCFVIFVFWYWFSPKNTDVGYSPKQPVPFSHRKHAGQLGIDCRYCHFNVERSPHASVPTTETCMNCHKVVKTDSPYIKKIAESYSSGKPIDWVKVHRLPDYVYFDHSRHVNSGVSCVECHGRIDEMTVVHQVKPLSMSWCLDCHRNPEPHLRPHQFITKLDWSSPDQAKIGAEVAKAHNIHPREDCSTCHR